MSQHNDYVEVISAKGPQQLSSLMKVIFWTMAIVGALAFLGSLLILDQKRIAWIALLHNTVYFTGLAAGGLAVAAITHVARSYWARPVKRFAEAMSAFLPVTMVCVALLWVGASMVTPAEVNPETGVVSFDSAVKGFEDPNQFIYEWAGIRPWEGAYHNKHFWLQRNFVFGRILLALGLLWYLGRRFRKYSDRTDFALAAQTKPGVWAKPDGFGDMAEEVETSVNKQTFWGVLYCFGYAFIFSLFVYDLVMSLDYRWVSTMFGGWNFTSGLLQSWGMLVFIAWWLGGRFDIARYMPKKMYHDLGKLTFAFTVMWGYLFFAQLNVIWYGNLGHETGYLFERFHPDGDFGMLGLTVATLVFLLPFLLGLGKNRKMQPSTFAPVVILSCIGLWLERFLLITPAAWYYDRATDSWSDGLGLLVFVDVLVLIGFVGIFCLCFTNYLYKRPIMVISDPKLGGGINRH